MNRIAKHASQIKQIVIGLLLACVLTFLYQNTQGIAVQNHSQTVDDLGRLKQTDAELNLDVYDLRFGLLAHYDSVTEKSQLLTATLEDLKRNLARTYPSLPDDIAAPVEAYSRTLTAKQASLEEFKSAQAILNNSLHFFPTVCTELIEKLGHGGSAHLATLADTLQDAIFLYHLNGDLDAKSQAAVLVRQLFDAYAACPPNAQEDLGLTLAHASAILREKERVRVLVANLMAFPGNEECDHLFQADTAHYQQALYRMNVSRLTLYLLCCLLALYVAWALVKLRWKSQDLNLANDTLERRVVERTLALERSHAELSASEQRHRTVVEYVRDIILTTDPIGNLTFLNPAWAAITGYSVPESLGTSFYDYILEEDRKAALAFFDRMTQNEKAECRWELRCRTTSGALLWLEARVQSTYAQSGDLTGFFGTLTDITERHLFEAQLQHQALHDALTGLPNRLLFQDRLHGALVRAHRQQTTVAVLFIDLDNFKIINDSMGHRAGDALLKTVAARLKATVHTEDTIARLGGDEFTALLEGLTDVAEALQIAEQIVAQLQAPIPLEEGEVSASASIGIVYSDTAAETPEDLLRDADTAMYHAKRAENPAASSSIPV